MFKLRRLVFKLGRIDAWIGQGGCMPRLVLLTTRVWELFKLDHGPLCPSDSRFGFGRVKSSSNPDWDSLKVPGRTREAAKLTIIDQEAGWGTKRGCLRRGRVGLRLLGWPWQMGRVELALEAMRLWLVWLMRIMARIPSPSKRRGNAHIVATEGVRVEKVSNSAMQNNS